MNLDLTQEHELVRSTVREFAEQRVAPVAEELDHEGRFPYELVAELSELGLMGMTIPEEYGGGGADTVSYAIAVEELTRVDSSVAITVAAYHSLGTLPIYYFGSEEQRREWLPELASGKRLATWPARFPLLRLDHVWIGKDIGVAGVTVPRDALTRSASDHLPIVADLVIEPSRVVTPQVELEEERAS